MATSPATVGSEGRGFDRYRDAFHIDSGLG